MVGTLHGHEVLKGLDVVALGVMEAVRCNGPEVKWLDLAAYRGLGWLGVKAARMSWPDVMAVVVV